MHWLARTETPASLLADAFASSARVAGPPALSLVSTFILSATQRSDYCFPSRMKTANRTRPKAERLSYSQSKPPLARTYPRGLAGISSSPLS